MKLSYVLTAVAVSALLSTGALGLAAGADAHLQHQHQQRRRSRHYGPAGGRTPESMSTPVTAGSVARRTARAVTRPAYDQRALALARQGGVTLALQLQWRLWRLPLRAKDNVGGNAAVVVTNVLRCKRRKCRPRTLRYGRRLELRIPPQRTLRPAALASAAASQRRRRRPQRLRPPLATLIRPGLYGQDCFRAGSQPFFSKCCLRKSNSMRAARTRLYSDLYPASFCSCASYWRNAARPSLKGDFPGPACAAKPNRGS